VDWIPTFTGPPATDHEGIVFAQDIWMAVGGGFNTSGAYNTIFTSTDGLNWECATNVNYGVRLRDVTYTQGCFVAAGNNGLVLCSTNGSVWKDFYVPIYNCRRVHAANGRLLLVGNNGGLCSMSNPADPDSLVAHRSRNSQNIHDIVDAPDGSFIMVGNNGMLLQSGDTRPQFVDASRTGTRMRFSFDPGLLEGRLRLEISEDMVHWNAAATNARSPVKINTVNSGIKYFRLSGP
jgi:hypothetical protein